jgi:hypothetical protein
MPPRGVKGRELSSVKAMSKTTKLEVYFHTTDSSRKLPYVMEEEPIIFTCDGTEGSITFDGYYYVEDHAPPYPEDEALKPWERPTRHSEWLPKVLQLYVKRRETEPYKVERIEPTDFDPLIGIESFGGTTYYYKTLEEYAYEIEIYRRVVHESTDRISEEEDEDGTPMRVCFFPTNRQTLYFRVLKIVLERVVEE